MNWYAQDESRLLIWDLSIYDILPHLIDFEPLMLFVEEIINYSLRQHHLSNWIPPMNLEYLRLIHAGKIYFQDSIGEAICHSCTESDAVSLAVEYGFNEQKWLHLEPSDAREPLVEYLELLLALFENTKESAVFKMFSFGCYLAKEAMKRKLNALTNEVVHALVRTCCLQFPYENSILNMQLLQIVTIWDIACCILDKMKKRILILIDAIKFGVTKQNDLIVSK